MVKLIIDKGGWLRVLEASIAILIVLSVLFVVTKQNNVQASPRSNDLGILEQIAMNDSMRNQILDYNIALKEDEEGNGAILKGVMDFVGEKLPPGYGYEVNICGALESCEFANDKVDTTSEERILSASLSKIENPMKVRLIYWPE